MVPFVEKFLKACNPDPSKAGKTLLVLNALGMLFAAASDTFAAAIDKNTSAENKKFLVPAGAATGVAKIALYYGMTDKIIKSLKNKADNIVKGMSEAELKEKAKVLAESKIAKASKGMFKKSAEYIDSMKESLLKDGNVTDKAIKLYKDNFKSGAGVLGAFVGAVVGCAIITPVIRDVSAYFVQKKMDKMQNKTQISAQNVTKPIETKATTITKPVSMQNYMALSSGSMKI